MKFLFQINDNFLRLLFISPLGSGLASLGCLCRLIERHTLYYEWLIFLVIICMAGIFVYGIKLFVINFIL